MDRLPLNIMNFYQKLNAFGRMLQRRAATADVQRFGAHRDAATGENGALKPDSL